MFYLVSVAAAGGAFGMWFYPGSRTVASAGGCTNVSAEPTSVVLALIGIAVLLAILGLNGRRLANVKLPGGIEATALAEEKKAITAAVLANPSLLNETEQAPVTGSSAQDSDPSTTDSLPSETVKVGGVELGVYRLDDVPTTVVRDLLSTVVKEHRLPEHFALDFVARKLAKGNPRNSMWLVKFRQDTKIWKVSYGGRGKSGPTVTVAG